MIPESETECREFVHKTFAALGESVSEAFIRYVMRPDVLTHVEEIANHYKTDAAGVVTLALPGFVATVMMGGLRPDDSDDDMPSIAKMFMRGYRLHMSGGVDDVLTSPNAAKPAKLVAALIERFLRHPELLDRANVPVAREAAPRAPAAT